VIYLKMAWKIEEQHIVVTLTSEYVDGESVPMGELRIPLSANSQPSNG